MPRSSAEWQAKKKEARARQKANRAERERDQVRVYDADGKLIEKRGGRQVDEVINNVGRGKRAR